MLAYNGYMLSDRNVCFMWACYRGDENLLEIIVGMKEFKWDLNFCFANPHPLLGMFKYVHIVKYLIENVSGIDDSYILFFASKGGFTDVVKYLILERNVDPNIPGFYSVLDIAILKNHLDIVKFLIECGKCDLSNSRFARLALDYHKYNIIDFFIQKGFYTEEIINSQYFLQSRTRFEDIKKKASKKIYFWWVQLCYDPDMLCGHRSMQKGYMEYKTMWHSI